MNSTGDNQLAYSEACERNKQPILAVLRRFLPATGEVLEVGSGTGQHIVFFAGQFPELRWLPADTGGYLPLLRARLTAEAPANVAAALELDVRMSPWPVADCAALFSANTLHFMSEVCGAAFFTGASQALAANGILLVYGPFRYGGEFTSPSNARFDQWLKADDPERGVRDFEWIQSLAEEQGLRLLDDIAMPANNQMLVWRKQGGQ